MNDWANVANCPLCGVDNGGVESGKSIPVHVHSTPVMWSEWAGITIPLSFGITYNRCLHCGLIYQNPQMTDDALERFYSADGLYRTLTKKDNYKVEEIRAKRIISIVKELECNTNTLLDIGCGHGELLHLCQENGIDAVGIDASNYAIDGVMVYPDFDNVSGNQYDAVTMLHYLEHTTDPMAELRRAASLSNKYVIVEVPLMNLYDNTKRFLNIQHTMIFDPWVLVTAFKMAGMEIVNTPTGANFIIVIGRLTK